MPIMPSSAGISVTAAVIVVSTTIAEATATPLRKLTPSTNRPEQRDDHGGAGEQHRPAGGVQRAHARGLGVAAGLDRVAVAGDDEQRVVDADAEADQGGERGGEGGDVDRVREQAGQGEAAAERQDRADQRQQRRPQRAEGEREHDRGGDEADQLARAAARLLRGLLDPAAAQLHLESVAARVLGGGDQLVVGGLGDVGDRLLAVHVDGRERDPAVLGDLAPAAPSANGLSTRSTCGSLGDRLQRASIRAWVAGSVTSSAAKTTWLVSVDSLLKFSVSRFRAVVDSVPGSENESV